MSIECTIQSVTLQHEDLQEHFPNLAMMINSSLPKQKTKKRRKRKKKETVGPMILEIIDSIETK